MAGPQEEIARILIEKGLELHKKPRESVPFTGNPEADLLMNNIEEYPHHFVLGCIMDRRIKAERAWIIPYALGKIIGGFGFPSYQIQKRKDLQKIFRDNSLHRHPDDMADNFYYAVQRIHHLYADDAANIWKLRNPSSAEVIRRLDDFQGVGQKISTMTTNILVREFKVPLADNRAIDISVDSQVEKVFKRMGFVPMDAGISNIIRAAREIYPAYPGLFDSVCWEMGREFCLTGYPNCE
jgi:endonuclease III